MALLRLFIATDITPGQRVAVERLIADLKKGVQFTQAHPSWVNPAGMHLTLKFLGSVEENRVKSIVKAVLPALAPFAPFDFSLAGLGAFPNARQPKVVWVGVKTGREELTALAQAVDLALSRVGFEREKRAFSAHLTLARIRALRGAGELMDVVESHRNCRLGLAKADALTLYQSTLAPEGAHYKALHRWELAQ